MSIPGIERWLNQPNRDYTTGVSLYRRYGNSRFVLDLLSQGADEYNQQRLVQELRQLNVSLSLPSVPATPAEPTDAVFSSLEAYTRFSVPQQEPIRSEELPESLQLLVVEKSSRYKQCCSLHQRLEYMPSDKERAAAAQLICDHFRRIDEIWQQLDYYQRHKIIRPKHGKDLSSFNMATLLKRRNTLRTYISRLRKAPDTPQYIQYSAELEAVQRMIDLREEDDA